MFIVRAVQVDNEIRNRERAANISNLIKAPSTSVGTSNTEEINIDEETGTNEKEDITLLAIEAASAALQHDSDPENTEKKEKEEETQKGKYIRREFSCSQFRQTLLLPENIDEEEIEAKQENGLLTIHIPKKKTVENTEPKKIQIK